MSGDADVLELTANVDRGTFNNTDETMLGDFPRMAAFMTRVARIDTTNHDDTRYQRCHLGLPVQSCTNVPARNGSERPLAHTNRPRWQHHAMADSMNETRQVLNDTLAQLGAALDDDHRAEVDHDTCTICGLKAELIPNPMHRPEPAQVPAARARLARAQPPEPASDT